MNGQRAGFGDLDVVRAAYAALAAQDVAGLISLTDPGVTVVEDDDLPFGGRYRGYAGLATFLTSMAHLLDWVVRTELLFVSGHGVVQTGRLEATVRASGRHLDVPEVHVWQLCGERVTALTVFLGTLELRQALGLGR